MELRTLAQMKELMIKTIATVDADGIALAAIQGLHEFIEDQTDQINSQKKVIDI